MIMIQPMGVITEGAAESPCGELHAIAGLGHLAALIVLLALWHRRSGSSLWPATASFLLVGCIWHLVHAWYGMWFGTAWEITLVAGALAIPTSLALAAVPARPRDPLPLGSDGARPAIADAEPSLQEELEMYRASFEQAPIGVAHLATDGTFLRANRRFCSIVGRASQELAAMSSRDIAHPADHEQDAEMVRELVEGGRDSYSGERRFVRADGLDIWVDIVFSLVRSLDGQPRHFVLVAKDITARKGVESQLKNLTRELDERVRDRTAMLEQSNKDLEQFAYVVSHDLQEPLRMVSSYVQILERRYRHRLDEEALEFIAYAVDGASRMKRLIRDLLTFSRVGTKGVELRPICLHETLDNVEANLALAIRESGAEIIRGLLPTVIGDQTQIAQLLQNLIANAIRYRGDARPRIRVDAEDRGDSWEVCVEDNGIGIEPRHSSRIFGVFQRLHDRGDDEGTGIGLAVCKRIAERHGGAIWVESELGAGARFCFTIPKAAALAAV